MNIIQILKNHSREIPNNVALIHRDDSITYAELEDRSSKLAHFFVKNGLTKGKKALLFIPLSIELYVLFLALARIGVVVVFIDPTADRLQMNSCIDLVKPDAFLGTPKAHLLRLYRSIRSIPIKFSTGFWFPGSRFIRYTECNGYIDVETDRDDPLLITFTSGSTGMPKGISRSHGFLSDQHQAIVKALPYEKEAIELNSLPIFILSNLASGITTVISNGEIGRDVMQIQQQRVNRLLASPSYCCELAEYIDKDNQKLEHIQHIYTGGGPVFPNMLNQLQGSFPNAEITSVYGSTEAEPIAHLNREDISVSDLKKMQSGQGLLAGRPVPQITLAIIPDQSGFPIGPFSKESFEAHKLFPEQIGEIVVAGDHVQKSFINHDSTHTKFVVDETIWHRTGDSGYLDEKGMLWLLGRCSAKVNVHGSLLYPFSIETAARSFHQISNAALVEIDNKAILAIELTNRNTSGLTHALQSLSSVDEVRIVKKIPMDKRHRSKVLYDQLKKELS